MLEVGLMCIRTAKSVYATKTRDGGHVAQDNQLSLLVKRVKEWVTALGPHRANFRPFGC